MISRAGEGDSPEVFGSESCRERTLSPTSHRRIESGCHSMKHRLRPDVDFGSSKAQVVHRGPASDGFSRMADPLAGGGGDMGSSLLVTRNAMRLLRDGYREERR